MKQADFEKKYSAFWLEIENSLSISFNHIQKHESGKGILSKSRRQSEGPGDDFPEKYRLVCHHLSLARSRHYSPLLVDRLERLVIHAHQIFYKRKSHFISSVLIYFTSGFAQSIRNEWRWIMLSGVLFFGAFSAMLITLQYYPDMVYTVISAEQLAAMESMYDPELKEMGRERGAGSDFQMFGYYIFNNTGIGLKTFASGLLFGIGTVLALIFNGLTIGGIAGYLTYIGYGSTFWPFVSGHSALELTAIVFSGAAGFKLAFSIISPGRKERLLSLKDSAKEAVYMMYGVVMMFVMAAFVEAYWSSMTDIPSLVKYSVGIIGWLLLLAYFMFAGRRHAA